MDGGATRVLITARQREVEPGFRSILPIEAVNGRGERRFAIASLDQEEETFEIEVNDQLVELEVGQQLWVLGVER